LLNATIGETDMEETDTQEVACVRAAQAGRRQLKSKRQ